MSLIYRSVSVSTWDASPAAASAAAIAGNGEGGHGRPGPLAGAGVAVPEGLADYPGAKGGEGVYHTIISQMPPHETYIEPFVGAGAVLRFKRPAVCSIAIDADAMVIGYWQRWIASRCEATARSAGRPTFILWRWDPLP